MNNEKSSDLSLKNKLPEDKISGRELEQLSRFAASLGTTIDVDILVQDAVEPLSAMAGANNVLIAISRTDGRLLIPQNNSWELNPKVKGLLAPPIAALGTEAIAFEKIEDIPQPIFSRLSLKKGYIAIVPLWAQAHLRGVIILNSERKPFTRTVLKMLTTAGRQFALAVENSRLLADLQDSYRKLMDAQEDLIRAERLAALGQLSATMAHEIRNPLTTIFSALSQIRKHGVKKEISVTLLDIAEEEAIRLNNMVSELLKFARPRKPELHDENLNETVLKAVETVKTELESARNINIEFESKNSKLKLFHDSEQIEQAVKILIENAIDAINEAELKEPGEVKIKIKKLDKGAVVTITDNGSGILDEHRVKIFEPFYSTRPTGTGLGLPTVKRIAEDHKGYIVLETKNGIKTTAQLYLQTKQRKIIS
ncbi:MAG: GHKL domain-containing protein [Deltaproteobacteria bacterium]|nr:GHKL domain-containing protein [Deltaproteobacteria bacterium]